MSTECLFCKIANRAIPAHILSESDEWMAFKDVQPQAPLHFLIIPKRHIMNIVTTVPSDTALVGSMLVELARLAVEFKVESSGFRIVNNCNRDGGQTVGHLHFHLLAGRAMHWPPG